MRVLPETSSHQALRGDSDSPGRERPPSTIAGRRSSRKRGVAHAQKWSNEQLCCRRHTTPPTRNSVLGKEFKSSGDADGEFIEREQRERVVPRGVPPCVPLLA